jgi:hypothetical protein
MESELQYVVTLVILMLGVLWISAPRKRPQQPYYHH